MKTENMPERTTLRRARAFLRATGSWPVGFAILNIPPTDTTHRLGRNMRAKVARKFMGPHAEVRQ